MTTRSNWGRIQTRPAPTGPATPLEIAGQVANRAAGRVVFQRYLEQKAANTLKRHGRDLELFAEYLVDGQIPLVHTARFQTDPQAWHGVTWGIVEGFVHWQLAEGFAIASVNARLSTVRTYAALAVKAGVISPEEGLLIQGVRGFSRQGGLNVDARREQTRKKKISYAYKLDGRHRRVVVTRRATRKEKALLLTAVQAAHLKEPANDSPQAWRDALLMTLLLDHGLRASELALLTVEDVDLAAGTLSFFRPKVQGTDHAFTTHRLTPTAARLARTYLASFYPANLKPNGPLILASSRLKKDGSGGALQPRGLSRVRLSERVRFLGRNLGLPHLSAHDCRHFCATQMARFGYGVDELMAWFGWTSAQTAMRYVAMQVVQTRSRG